MILISRSPAARRIFPRCWFNEKPTEAGRDALGYYHERRDPNRNVGLGAAERRNREAEGEKR